MKLVYAISRWSNPNRAAALHIDNGEEKPLCGGAGRKAFSWEREEGEPTCKRCVRLSNKAGRRLPQERNHCEKLVDNGNGTLSRPAHGKIEATDSGIFKSG